MKAVQGTAEQSPRFSNYSGDVGVGRINTLNRTLTYRVVNATTAAGTYVIFGHDEYGTGVTANAGCDTGITVTNVETSALQVARDSAKGPFFIAGCKIRTSDVDQFSNNILIREQSSTGKLTQYQIQPSNFESPLNQQDKLLIATPEQFSLNVTGMTAITGEINAGVTLTYTFTLGARVDIGQVNNGNPAVSVSSADYPTGQAPMILKTPSAGVSNGVGAAVPLIAKGGVSPLGPPPLGK